jgi:hypothetical protein
MGRAGRCYSIWRNPLWAANSAKWVGLMRLSSEVATVLVACQKKGVISQGDRVTSTAPSFAESLQ